MFPSRPPAFIGVLALDTRFPRLPGDIGNPASFGVPALTRVVRGVRPRDAVQSSAGQRAAGLLEPFMHALRAFEREGAAAITTTCGFLVLMQVQLQYVTRLPVVTSSLTLLPQLLEHHRRVGVLTASARDLEWNFLRVAGVPEPRRQDVIIEGVDPDGEFARVFLGDRPTMDFDRVRRDVIEAAARLQARVPDVTDVVLECTNMAPWARAIEQATGWRTWSLLQCERLFAPWRAHVQ